MIGWQFSKVIPYLNHHIPRFPADTMGTMSFLADYYDVLIGPSSKFTGWDKGCPGPGWDKCRLVEIRGDRLR